MRIKSLNDVKRCIIYLLTKIKCNPCAQEVYCGKESICTVEGLNFSTVYKARVKSFNHAGQSIYSQCTGLQTSDG